MLHHEEKQVKEMIYDPTHPVDKIFHKIEDLSDLYLLHHKLNSPSNNLS